MMLVYHAQQQIFEQMCISDNLQNIIENRSQWKKILKKKMESTWNKQKCECVWLVWKDKLFSPQTNKPAQKKNQKQCLCRLRPKWKHSSVIHRTMIGKNSHCWADNMSSLYNHKLNTSQKLSQTWTPLYILMFLSKIRMHLSNR